MISPSGDLRVYVATRPVDFRNYVATMIMQSELLIPVYYLFLSSNYR